MEVAGQKVKIVTGRKTQTVNVYAANDEEGVYSDKIRISSPAEFVIEDLLASHNFETIADMVRYLQQAHHGVIETPFALSSPARLSRAPKVEVSQTWCNDIAGCVEGAINAVVTAFASNSYQHRVEQSLHCQLYMELLQCPELNGFHRIASQNVGFLHKEYPETTSRPYKDRRRGNFDMAILGPVENTGINLTIMDFMLGLIKPGIAIEVGLDYGAHHLHSDWLKLRNSQIQRGYLLHLARSTGNPQDDRGLVFLDVCHQIMAEEASGGPQLAMCVFEGNKQYLRLLGQTGVTRT